MNTLIVYAIAALALFAAGVTAGHKITSNAWKADMLTAQQEHAKEIADANDRNNDIARQLEDAREHVRVVYREIEKQVDRIVERPVYRSECIDDDGLHVINDALRGHAVDPGKSDGEMPASIGGPGREDGSGPGSETNRNKPAVLRLRRAP